MNKKYNYNINTETDVFLKRLTDEAAEVYYIYLVNNNSSILKQYIPILHTSWYDILINLMINWY